MIYHEYSQPRSVGWCATCVPGANAGQAGYCDPTLEGIDVSSQIYRAIFKIQNFWFQLVDIIFCPDLRLWIRSERSQRRICSPRSCLGLLWSKMFCRQGRHSCLGFARGNFLSRKVYWVKNPLFKVKLWILSEEECRNRTWTHSKAKFRARVDRSIFDGILMACQNLVANW